MPNYATQSDLEDYFGTDELLVASDRNGDGVPDTGVVTAALTSATEEVDSYLASRYDLPLSPVPGVLLHITADIAMYRMSFGHTSMTEEKRQRYEDAIKWLTNLSKGVTTLGPEEETVTSSDAPQKGANNEARLFTRTKMAGLM